jgi:hypothetical protein
MAAVQTQIVLDRQQHMRRPPAVGDKTGPCAAAFLAPLVS